MPGSRFCVVALNALQNSMILSPRCPSAGPIGGEGFALPAGTCNLMIPTIFFAIYSNLSRFPSPPRKRGSGAYQCRPTALFSRSRGNDEEASPGPDRALHLLDL